MRKMTLLLVVALLAVSVFAPTVSAQDDALTLVIGTTDDVAELDPADAYAFHDWELLRNTNEALLGYVPGDVNLEPRLATDFPTVSEDGLTYTFTLRDDAMFPSGEVLTAEMYADSVKRAITLQGDVYGLISMIADVAADGQNVVFTLSEPFDLFPQVAALTPLMPAHPDLYAADEITNQPEALYGVGAYQVTEYTIGERTVLERNPNYFGEPGAYERIIFVYYEEPSQLDLAIETGEIDMAWRSNTVTEIERLDEIENLEVMTVSGGTRYLTFNQALEPGNDPLVRQAIATAINRDEIVDRALSGQGTPLYSMVPPGFLGAAESYLDVYGFGDAEAARGLLEEAGYSEDNKLVMDLWYPPNRYGGTAGPAMEVIEQQLEATGVVEVNLQSAEWSTYIVAATTGEYPIFFLGWFFDYPDSDNYIHPFASCAGSPGLGINYCNEEMEALITNERSLVSASVEERAAALEEVQTFYAEEAITVPLFYVEDFNIYNSAKVDNVLIGATQILEYRILQPVS